MNTLAKTNEEYIEIEGLEWHEEAMSDWEFERMMERGHRQWLETKHGRVLGSYLYYYRRYMPRPRVVIAAVVITAILVALSGCSFHIGVDYTGKSGKSNITETPDFRRYK